MRSLLFMLLAGVGLSGCNGSSTEPTEKLEQQSATVETTKVTVQFNLPAEASILNTQNVSLNDSLSFNAAISTDVCDPEGKQQLLSFYFVKTAPQKWDIYLSLDEELQSIEGGETGGTGQLKATLEFDDEGKFVRQHPYIIKTTEIRFPEKDYNIEIDFYSKLTTHFDDNFEVKHIDSNGC